MILYNNREFSEQSWFGGCGTIVHDQRDPEDWDPNVPVEIQDAIDQHTGVLVYEGEGPELSPEQAQFNTRHTFTTDTGEVVTIYLRNTGKFPHEDKSWTYIGDPDELTEEEDEE